MQLPIGLPNESQVIHVVRRNIPTGVPNPFDEAPPNESGSHEQRPSALGAGFVPNSEYHFEGGYTMPMHIPGEYFCEGLPPVHPSPPTNPIRPDSFNFDLAAQGYNSPFQSTFSLADTGTGTSLNPQEGHNNHDVIPVSYPEYMFDTLSFTSDLPVESRDYHPLWRYILEYWFPSTSGFSVVQDWDPKSSYGYRVVHQDNWDEDPPRHLPSFTVFDMALPAEPFLFVFIPSNIGIECNLARLYAREAAKEGFETLRACSFTAGFRSLCVVSAIEAKWGMFIRDLGWMESESGFDCIGEWEEDVTSDGSFEVMGYYFEEMKKDIMAMRR